MDIKEREQLEHYYRQLDDMNEPVNEDLLLKIMAFIENCENKIEGREKELLEKVKELWKMRWKILKEEILSWAKKEWEEKGREQNQSGNDEEEKDRQTKINFYNRLTGEEKDILWGCNIATEIEKDPDEEKEKK